MKDEETSLFGRLAFLSLLAVVALLPWPWGSVAVWSQSMTLVLTGTGLVLSLIGPEGARWPRSGFFRFALLLWLLWLLWIGFSLVPLPAPLLAELSPAAAALHAPIAAMGIAPASSLSVEPVASRAAWLTTFGLLGLYLLSARTVQGDARRKILLMTLAVTAGAQAFYGLGMTLTGREYGFLAKKSVGLGWATGTFVNRNHFAHLLALGAAAALALLLTQHEAPNGQRGWRGRVIGIAAWLMSPALIWRVLLLVMLVAVVLSQSRAGNLVFVVIVAIGVLAWMLLHDRARLMPAVLLLGSFAAADLLIVSHYYGLDRVVGRLENTELESEQRAVALRDVAPLVERYGRIGSGLGSFQSVFMPVQSPELRGRYDHAHNEFAEFAIEAGFLGLGWVLLMGALHLLHAARLLKTRRRGGARALGLATALALIAAAAHALTDFILHVPALRGWLVVLMGAAAATGVRLSPTQRAVDDQT